MLHYLLKVPHAKLSGQGLGSQQVSSAGTLYQSKSSCRIDWELNRPCCLSPYKRGHIDRGLCKLTVRKKLTVQLHVCIYVFEIVFSIDTIEVIVTAISLHYNLIHCSEVQFQTSRARIKGSLQSDNYFS